MQPQCAQCQAQWYEEQQRQNVERQGPQQLQREPPHLCEQQCDPKEVFFSIYKKFTFYVQNIDKNQIHLFSLNS
jgi:hypothetical protein